LLELSLPGYALLSPSDFKIKELLAKGGGGSVYFAEPLTPALRQHGKVLVAKIFYDSFEQLSTAQKVAFEQEVAVLHYLKSSSHIAKFLGFTESPCCILMKFYPEGSLEKWIYSNRKFSRMYIVCMVRDVGYGLRSMHELSIAHCDVKPQNVLLEVVGRSLIALLTDFGIANVLSETLVEVKAFKVANLKGFSVSYAAPEAFVRLKNNMPDKPVVIKAGDVYSLGVIIFEMLHRASPWRKRSAK
jgi:serine/threonine protein kinase